MSARRSTSSAVWLLVASLAFLIACASVGALFEASGVYR